MKRADVVAAVEYLIGYYGMTDLDAVAAELNYGGKNPGANLERVLYRAERDDLVHVLVPHRKPRVTEPDHAEVLIVRLDAWLLAHGGERYSTRPVLRRPVRKPPAGAVGMTERKIEVDAARREERVHARATLHRIQSGYRHPHWTIGAAKVA